MRRLTLTIVLAAATALSVAAPALSDPIYPLGVSQRDIVSGLYQADAPHWCCWMGPQTVLDLPAPAGADVVVITILVPSYAVVRGGTAITAYFDGVRSSRACCFVEGVSQTAFVIPHPQARARRLTVRLVPSTHFIPARRGLNHDTRTLSVLLRSVIVENTVTGQRYLDGVPVVEGPNRTQILMRNVLFTLVGLVSLALTVRRLALGWVLLVLTAPFGLSGVTVLGVFAGVVWARRVSLRPIADARVLTIAALVALLSLVMLASAFRAHFVSPALYRTGIFAAYLPAFLLAAFAYRCDPEPLWLRRTLVAVTILVSGLALLQLRYGSPESMLLHGHVVTRIAGPLEGPNQLGAFLEVVLPLLFAFAVAEKMRLEEGVALVIGAVALLCTYSRAGIVACALAFVVVLALRVPARRIVLAVVFVAWLAAAGVVIHAAESQTRFAYVGGLGTHAELWHEAIAMWRTRPLLGVGPGNYELLVSSSLPGVRTHPNEYYLQSLCEEGVIGLALLLALVAGSVYALSGRRDALAMGMLAVVIAFAFHQLVDGLWLYPKVGDVYWVLLGIAAIPTRSQYTSPTLGYSNSPSTS